MEENENEFLSMFSDNTSLNFDIETTEDEDLDLEDIVPNETDKDPVEEDDPENVDEGEDDNENEGDSPDDESSPNLYSSIVNVLQEQGIIPSFESSDEIKTSDDLVNVFKKEIEIQTQTRLDEYLENLDVSKIAESKRTQMTLDEYTEDYLKENLEVAKNIIYQDYLNQGLSEDRAKKLLKKTIDLGEDILLEDALESKESIKVFESKRIEAEKLNYKEQIEAQRKEQEQIDTKIKSTIYNTPELIKGVKATKAVQDRVYKSMTEIVGKNPNTGELENKLMQDRAKDPIGFDTRMYYLYELTKGFTTFDKVEAQTKTKAINDLEKVLRKTKFEDNGTPTYLQDDQSYSSGFGTELVL